MTAGRESTENAYSGGYPYSGVYMMQARGQGMVKMQGRDFEAELEAAGDEAEQEADQALLDATIEERLAALADDGQDIGEAERVAASAEEPKVPVVAIAGRPMTKRMIAFAQGVIEGKSRVQAYREAYNNTTAQDNTVSASAAKLMRDPRVRRMVEAGWEETQETLADDIQAVKRYVSRSLVALSKAGKQENTRLRALELLGKTAGMFRETQEQKQIPVTAEQLRKELAGHLRLLNSGKRQG